MTSNSYNGGLVWSSLGYNPIKKMLLAVGLQDRGKSQIATIAKYLAGKGKFSLLRTRQLEDRFELGAYRDSNLPYAGCRFPLPDASRRRHAQSLGWW